MLNIHDLHATELRVLLQDADARDVEASERRMSSAQTSSSSSQSPSGVPHYPGALPPRPPEQHQSRSKRLASKLLKKMGTKERFRNAHPETIPGEWLSTCGSCWLAYKKYSTIKIIPSLMASCLLCCYHYAGSGVQGGRPAYSPDAFDDSPKKGKLAQRLLVGGKGMTGKLVFGNHVAGRGHHQWPDSFAGGGFEGPSTMRAEDVQQASCSHLPLLF